MIKELRIGNLVKCKISNDAGIYQIEAINGLSETVYLDGGRHRETIPIEKIKPIQLTEEWLEKFGFAKTEYGLFIYKPSDDLEPNVFKDCRWITLSKLMSEEKLKHPFLRFDRTDIHYVHHLQNLFFAITGLELEIQTEKEATE